MRVRVLIDTIVNDSDIPGLQRIIRDQPTVIVFMPDPFGQTIGRLMGAVPVEAAEETEAH